MPQLPWFIWLMLGIMLVSFIMFKVLPGIKKAGKLFAKPYNVNPQGNLAPEQQNALNIGAVTCEQNNFYTNSLTTGFDLEAIKEMLADSWGVTDRESALDTIGWLLNEGHRIYYDGLRPLLRNIPDAQKSQRQAMLAQLFEEPEKASGFLENLEETEGQLKEEGFVTSEADWDLGILAWDTGRAVTVARTSYDAGYLSDAAAWDAIFYAAQLSFEKFNSWKEFGRSYAIGRAMWSGKGDQLDAIFSIIKGLEKDAESPWVKYPFTSYAPTARI